MKRMQAQSVEIGAIHPPSYDGGYRYSCVGGLGTAQAVESLHSNQDENHYNLVFRVKWDIIKEF